MPSLFESMKSAAAVSFIAVSRYSSLGTIPTVFPLGTTYSKDKPYPSLKSYFFSLYHPKYSLRKRLCIQALFVITVLPFLAQIIGVLMGLAAAILASTAGGIMSCFSKTANWFSSLGAYFVREPLLMGLPLLYKEGLVNSDLFALFESTSSSQLISFLERLDQYCGARPPILRFSQTMLNVYQGLHRTRLLRIDVLKSIFDRTENTIMVTMMFLIYLENLFKNVELTSVLRDTPFIVNFLDQSTATLNTGHFHLVHILNNPNLNNHSEVQFDTLRRFLRTATRERIDEVGNVLLLCYRKRIRRRDKAGIFRMLEFHELAAFIINIIEVRIPEQLWEHDRVFYRNLLPQFFRVFRRILNTPNLSPDRIRQQIYAYVNEQLVQRGYPPIRFEDDPARPFTHAQNTHTASVHESVGASLVRLRDRYSSLIDSDQKMQAYQDAILAFFENGELHFEHENRNQDSTEERLIIEKNDVTPHELDTAKKILNRIFDMNSEFGTTQEAISHQTIYQTLVYFWLAIWDRENWNPGVRFEDGVVSLIKTLHQIQRGYNLTDANNQYGYIDSRPDNADRPICVGGTFNALVSGLVGIHPDAEIIFATKETLQLRIEIIVNEYAHAIIESMNIPEDRIAFLSQEKTLSLLDSLKKFQSEGLPRFWSEIENDVKNDIRSEFVGIVKISREEFEGFIDNAEFANLNWESLNAILRPLIQGLEKRLMNLSNSAAQEDSLTQRRNRNCNDSGAAGVLNAFGIFAGGYAREKGGLNPDHAASEDASDDSENIQFGV